MSDTYGPALDPYLNVSIEQSSDGTNTTHTDLAPGSGVELTGPGASFSQSVAVAGNTGFLTAQVGEIHSDVFCNEPGATGDDFNQGGGTANATFFDVLTPTQNMTVLFTPIFEGSISNTAAGSQYDLVIGDHANPSPTLVEDHLVGGGPAGQPTTVKLLAGHNYDMEVSLRIDAAGEVGDGVDINGFADYANTGGVLIQELDASNHPIAGNPGLISASGYNYSVAPACFARGTSLATEHGERAVDSLIIGDLVRTANGALRPIKWIGWRSYSGRFLTANPHVHPIRFRAGSLGGGLPVRDLLVSRQHAMFLDGCLIPAECLVNGSTIVGERGMTQVDYFHIELESHDVLLAEGAASESYVDDDNRGSFHNATTYAARYPHPHPPGQVALCAPRVTCGPRLEMIRRGHRNLQAA